MICTDIDVKQVHQRKDNAAGLLVVPQNAAAALENCEQDTHHDSCEQASEPSMSERTCKEGQTKVACVVQLVSKHDHTSD